MAVYADYESYSTGTGLNKEAKLIIALIVAVVMVGTVTYAIGFQQGSVTTNAVNNTKETEQPTYIERSSEAGYVRYDYPTNYGYQYPTYYTYNYESAYSYNYCSPWLAEAYRDGCPNTGPIVIDYPTHYTYNYQYRADP